jgi:hypothetical protein
MKREKFIKLPEMSSTANSQVSKKEAVRLEVAPLKLPGLSGSTQASTLNEKKKTNKNDKVYKKSEIILQTPKTTKKTIDFKILNLNSLNKHNRHDNFSRQSSVISETPQPIKEFFSPHVSQLSPVFGAYTSITK